MTPMLLNSYAIQLEVQLTKNNKNTNWLVCYSTRRTDFKKQSNWWQYATELMCVLKWNKRDSFQKNNNLLLYDIQLVCILKWNKMDRFSKKSNWWQYATELVCEMKQEGQFSKNNNLLLYAIQLVFVLKWNKRCSSQKNLIDDNMLLNSYAKWNKRGS